MTGCNLFKTVYHKGGETDHFKNGRFHNINNHGHGIWPVLKWLVTRTKSKWPKNVSNKAYPIPFKKVTGNDIKVTFIGHITFLIQTQGLNILTDPVWSDHIGPTSWLGPDRTRQAALELKDMPKIDIIILSHDHYDHADIDSLKFFIDRDNPKIFTGLGVDKAMESHISFPCTTMDWWDSNTVSDFLKITFVPVQHFSGRGLFTRNATLWGGFVLETPANKIFFAGDTGYCSHFKEIYEKFGPMNLSLLPIGAYEPRWFMKHVHMNPDDAVMAHKDLKSKLSIGTHFGTFQLTDEPINQPVKDLQKALDDHKVAPDQFITLDFGQGFNL
tara:strand:+ start:21450 stop:22436 length:987 start_codon:yes stop_codon:yes gene_type:complete